MKSTFKIYVICWGIFLVSFNLIAFLTPGGTEEISKFNGSFWVGYAFITLSFIGQLVCAWFAFRQNNPQKFFYHVSLIRISYSATIVSVIAGALCMALPFIPAWIGAVVCILILTFSAVSVFKAKAAVDIVSGMDETIREQTLFIKSLTADAEALMARAKSEPVRSEIKKVYEAVRYSDPMSNAALSVLESQITLKFESLYQYIDADSAEEVRSAAEELILLVNDRNKKCKLLK